MDFERRFSEPAVFRKNQGGSDSGRADSERTRPEHDRREGAPRTSPRRESESTTFIRRREHKFEVSAARGVFLREQIAKELPLFEFFEGFPHTYVTTVYYDTVDRKFYQRAESSYDDNLKIRVKEYSYRSRDGSFLSFPTCYVELKMRRGGSVIKRRVPIPKGQLEAVLGGIDVWDSVCELVPEPTPELERSYEALSRFLRSERVVASSIISYRRTVFQRSERELRVTFDDEIAVFEVGGEIYGEQRDALTPNRLGVPVRRHDRVIVEVKCPDPQLPDWLRETLRHHRSKELSKFTTSIRFLTDSSDSDATPSEELGPPEEQSSGERPSGGAASSGRGVNGIRNAPGPSEGGNGVDPVDPGNDDTGLSHRAIQS